jgi:alpha-N-arabinofuranosidase
MYQPKDIKQHYGLDVYDFAMRDVVADGNVYTNDTAAAVGDFEKHVARINAALPILEFDSNGDIKLKWQSPQQTVSIVTTELLGKARIPDAPFENPDGSPFTIDRDYFGRKRNTAAPNAGPFEGGRDFKVWPKMQAHE